MLHRKPLPTGTDAGISKGHLELVVFEGSKGDKEEKEAFVGRRDGGEVHTFRGLGSP